MMTNYPAGNLLADVPCQLPEERIESLLTSGPVTLERIVSTGHSTPPGEWYDQRQAEWVLVVKGRAQLRFEDEATARSLEAGDYVFIPPRARHRVDSTCDTEPTVWLALHIAPNGADGQGA